MDLHNSIMLSGIILCLCHEGVADTPLCNASCIILQLIIVNDQYSVLFYVSEWNKKHTPSLILGSVFPLYLFSGRNQQTIGHLLIQAHSFPTCADTCLFMGSLRWASYKMCRREVGSWEMKGARSPRKLERWVQWSEQWCSCHRDGAAPTTSLPPVLSAACQTE